MASRSLTSLTKSQLVDLIGQLTLENDRHGAAAASESFGDFGDVSSSRGSHSRAGGRGAASKTHGALGGSLGGIPESSGVASESVSHTWGGDREDREVSSSPSPAPSASRPPSKGRRASKAASSGPEYDPSRSGCMPSTLAEYVAADVEEDLKSVPGIGDKAKERLNAVGITTTHQLLAKFLSFHTKGATTQGMCNDMTAFLAGAGISSHRSTVVQALGEKLATWIPGFYDEGALDVRRPKA